MKNFLSELRPSTSYGSRLFFWDYTKYSFVRQFKTALLAMADKFSNTHRNHEIMGLSLLNKVLIPCVLLAVCFTANAQNVNIPNAAFKNALLAHDPVIDTNGDMEIQVSEAENFSGTLIYPIRGSLI